MTARVKTSEKGVSMAPLAPPTAAPLSNEAYIAHRRTELLNQQSWDQATKATLAALGVGAGLRGLYGLINQVGRNTHSPSATVPAPMAVDVPINVPAPEKPRRRKYAEDADWAYAVTGPAKKLWDMGVSAVGKGVEKGTEVVGGSQASSPVGLPQHLPRMILGPVAAGAAGYKLTDWLLDQRRRKAVEEDVDDAKQEYEAAIFGKGAEAVDGLFDELEKQANFSMGDVPGAVGGAYLTYALASPLLMGNIAYENAKKMRRKNLIDAAQKARMRLRYETSPAPVFATPSQRQPAQPEDAEKLASPLLRGGVKKSNLAKLVGDAAEAGGKRLTGLFHSPTGAAAGGMRDAVSGAVGAASAPGSNKLLRALQEHPRLLQALGLMGGGAALGAGFGALQRPGGNSARGAIIGGMAGLGAGAGLGGGNAFMDTGAADHIENTSMEAPTVLAAGGGGAALGLRAGRGLANLMGVQGRKGDNPHNDLEELDITRRKDWLPI